MWGSVPSAFVSLRFGWVFSNSVRAVSFLSWKHSEAITEQMDEQEILFCSPQSRQAQYFPSLMGHQSSCHNLHCLKKNDPFICVCVHCAHKGLMGTAAVMDNYPRPSMQLLKYYQIQSHLGEHWNKIKATKTVKLYLKLWDS